LAHYIDNKVFERTISVFQCSKRDQVKYLLIIEDVKLTLKRLKARKAKKETQKQWTELLKKKSDEYEEIMEDYQSSKEILADAFATLSENLARYKKFENIDVDDAIQEGVLICFEKIDRFNPVKGAAFNYMTICILNHFRQLYRSHKHYNDLKSRYLDFIRHQVCDSLFNGTKNRAGFSPGQKNRYSEL